MPEALKKFLIHTGLFVATFITTTMAGMEFTLPAELARTEGFWVWEKWAHGMQYSVPFLLILGVHEFGHYFTARLYGLKVTLPYFIPFPSLIGTMGAVIRIKSKIRSTKGFFDVGIAGPLAGFVIAMSVLFYGFTHLPPAEYVFDIHPEYEKYGLDYSEHVYTPEFYQEAYNLPPGEEAPVFKMGKNLMFLLFEEYVVEDKSRIPNAYEMYHYPYLLAGYLALFFTALNLMPIGQLDGGHILYGLVGDKYHRIVSSSLFLAFVFYAGTGLVTVDMGDYAFLKLVLYPGFLFWIFLPLSPQKMTVALLVAVVFAGQFFLHYFSGFTGYPGWLLFALLLSRLLGIYHPQAEIEERLDTNRQALGWLSLLIFLLCFTPEPFSFG